VQPSLPLQTRKDIGMPLPYLDVQSNLSNLMLNKSHKVSWIKEVVGLQFILHELTGVFHSSLLTAKSVDLVVAHDGFLWVNDNHLYFS